MKKHLFFPAFNGFICAVLGSLVGYYAGSIAMGLLAGALIGLLVGAGVEWALTRLGTTHWLYQRRVLLTVLLELPLAIFVCGPYAYVLAETRPDPHPVCCETPLDYGASSYEDVRIQASDDVTLAGWYVPPRDAPGAVVVLLHGARRDRRATAWHARQFIEAGYGVLLYDQRALGESSGRRVSLGWYDGPDLLAVVDYLTDRPEVDPQRIGAVGLSGGAHIALNAAHLEPDRFAALWLDGVQSQRLADFPEPENLGERFALLINGLILKLAELHLGRPAPAPFVKILAELDSLPIVLVVGGLEDFERRVGERYASVACPEAEVWLIEDAYHIGGPAVDPGAYSRRMLAFFQASFAP